jgi:hypothetical protein
MAAPREPARPDPGARAQLPVEPPRRAYAGQSWRRSITGIVILLAMLIAFAGFGYYGVSLALEKLTNIELPRPAFALPALPDLGIEWPSWLTGVVGGSGEVLVVTGVPEGLRLRTAPSLSADTLVSLPNNTRVRKLDGPQVADAVPWMHVRATIEGQDLEGWASANFLKPE